MVIGFKKIAPRLMEKHARVNFVLAQWIINVIKEIGNYFHNNFNSRFRAHQ
jgi:hypothetical protein